MKDFANSLSAHMMGTDVDTYTDFYNQLLESLPKLKKAVEQVRVRCLDDYQKAMELKGILSGLFCYTFNNHLQAYKEVGELEHELGMKLLKFARSYGRIRDKRVRAVAKYMITCWRYYFTWEDQEEIIRIVRDAHILWKKDSYLITGLHFAVGDNTFTVGRNGKEYRNYVETCALQAFYVNPRWQKILHSRRTDAPDLPPYYEPTIVEANAKCSAKVYLSWEEKNLIPLRR